MELPADAPLTSRQTRWLTRPRAMFIGWRLVLLLIAAAAFYGGIKLRWRLYHDSEAIRFKGDIANGWNQGTAIYKAADQIRYTRLNEGATTRASAKNVVPFRDYFTALRGRYDTLFTQVNNDDYGLDYPPARLLIMSSWVWYSRSHVSGPIPPPWDMNLVTPLLRLNTTVEALAALAVFMIVRRVLTIDGSRHAATCGLIGALLAWFCLPELLDAHVWPQWDTWLLPFYLWGSWFALRNNWLVCGALLAIGAMCKGQMLMAAPALLLWPILGGRLWAAADLLLGFAIAALLFASPWLLNNDSAEWLFLRLLVCAVLAVLIQRRFSMRLLLLSIAVTLLFSGLRSGSTAWYFVGFAYGARHFEMMLHIGLVPNLASLLGDVYHWSPQEPIAHIPWLNITLTTRMLLVSLNALATVACGAALALQSRRRDRRLLLALALPWITTACLMPQMHERYLLWAAVCTALAAGVSLGTTLLHLAIVVWAAVPIATGLVEQVDRSKLSPAALASLESWHNLLRNAWPGNAWSVLTLAAIWLYLSFTPSRRTGLTSEGTP